MDNVNMEKWKPLKLVKPPPWIMNMISIILIILLIIMVFLLCLGIIMLCFGVIVIIFNDIIIVHSYGLVAHDIRAYIKKNKVDFFVQFTKHGNKYINIIEKNRIILVGCQFLIHSALRSVIWIGKYYVFFGLYLTGSSLLGLLGYCIPNMMMILLFAFSSLFLFSIMVYFTASFSKIIQYVAQQSLTEFYSFFIVTKCTVCGFDVDLSADSPLKNPKDYLSNIIAVGSGTYKCCGIDFYKDMVRSFNSSLIVKGCCKENVTKNNCMTGRKIYLYPPCRAQLISYLNNHTSLKYNNLIFAWIINILLCLSVVSFVISLYTMFKQHSYCFYYYYERPKLAVARSR